MENGGNPDPSSHSPVFVSRNYSVLNNVDYAKSFKSGALVEMIACYIVVTPIRVKKMV